MRRPSPLILLIFAFVGGNLLMAISYNARSTKNSTDPRYGSIRRLKVCAQTVAGKCPAFPRSLEVQNHRLENVRTDDYQPVDPSPSSKATIIPGPIEHGTPILPYVPRYPPPPSYPEDVPSAGPPGDAH